MAAEERIEVNTATVGCDGGGASGHPMVYLKIGGGKDGGGPREITCPYCSRHFVLSDDAPAEAGH